MGNVPISCCRSQSPCLDGDSTGIMNGINTHYRSSNDFDTPIKRKLSDRLMRGVGVGISSNGSSQEQLRSPQASIQNILQHISEREPDDTETDPSSNPLNRPILNYMKEDGNLHEDRLKASSCSTIFIDDSTISQPNLDQTIKCVSLEIYYHIQNRTSDEVIEIFDESLHPLKMPTLPIEQINSNSNDNDLKILMRNKSEQAKIVVSENDQISQQVDSEIRPQVEKQDKTKMKHNGPDKMHEEPSQEAIYEFVTTLFKSARLTSEYAITTLVYLERLMTYTEMDLTPKSWRRMFLGAILLSSKVWEDQAVWNVDYAQILEEISVDDINELERQFLEYIQFNMNVSSSVYAKYYFHLRTLALKYGLTEEQRILTNRKARDLEAMSKVNGAHNEWCSSTMDRKMDDRVMKKHISLEGIRCGGNGRAVLM